MNHTSVNGLDEDHGNQCKERTAYNIAQSMNTVVIVLQLHESYHCTAEM